MHLMRLTCGLLLLSLAGAAHPQSSSVASESGERAGNGVSVNKLIAAVAKKTGKKFVIDPRVRADIEVVGEDIANINYSELFTILHAYGLAAVEYGGYVNVIPDAAMRQSPTPVVSGKDTRPDAEFVSTVISVKNVSAAQLVPILRPLLPQAGHLAALPCVNKLIMVDTFANVRRVEALIATVDVGQPYKLEGCDMRPPAEPRTSSESRPAPESRPSS